MVQGASLDLPYRNNSLAFPLLVVAFTGGFIALVYPFYAPRRGWRVDPSFRKSGSLIMSVAMASVVASSILTLTNMPWWYFLMLLGGGAAAGALVMHLVKSLAQVFSMVLIVVSWLWYFVTVSRF
jgi:membrane-associated HD superfamily phosphohydrolase